MRINYVLISYKLNCLAETTLASLRDLKVYIIHVGKKQYVVNAMLRARVRIAGEWTEPTKSHGKILDCIFSDAKYSALRDCDYLFFIDHDCYFGNFNLLRNDFVDAAVSNDPDIVAFRHTCRCADRFDPDYAGYRASYFCTIPCFMAKVKDWPASWKPIGGGYFGFQNAFFDTGQAIAWSMHCAGNGEKLHCIDYRDDDKYWFEHFGCWWCDRSRNKTNNGAMVDQYAVLFARGLFIPALYELDDFLSYPLLEQALLQANRMRRFAPL